MLCRIGRLAKTARWFGTGRLGMNYGNDQSAVPQTAPGSEAQGGATITVTDGVLPDGLDFDTWKILHPSPCIRRFFIDNDKNQHSEGTRLSSGAVDAHALLMTEVMAECTVNNVIPTKLAQASLAQLRDLREALVAVSGSGNQSTIRCMDSEFIHGIHNAMEILEANATYPRNASSYFKRSVDKGKLSSALTPTNLHIQCLLLADRPENAVIRFDFTTVGAFTAQFYMDDKCGLCALWKLPAQPSDADTRFSSVPDDMTWHRALDILKAAFFIANQIGCLVRLLESRSMEARELVEQARYAVETICTLLNSRRKRSDIALVPKPDIDSDLQNMSHCIPVLCQDLVIYLLENLRTVDPGVLFRMFLREQIVMSQLITATVASVMTWMYTRRSQLSTAGRSTEFKLLVYFESLLSCWDDEKIMMEDIVGGMMLLKDFGFRIPLTNRPQPLSLDHIRIASYEKEIILPPLHCENAAAASENILVRIVPVFLNVGINEKATTAERLPNLISFQQENNVLFGEKLVRYAENRQNCCEKGRDHKLHELTESFRRELRNNLPKNTDLLRTAEDLVHHLGGLRVTMCKSAKDRTAMAVTLEELSILRQYENISPQMFSALLAETRRSGTRRENTVKNIGFPKYAFAQDQFEHLPGPYQPPPGTYGKAVT